MNECETTSHDKQLNDKAAPFGDKWKRDAEKEDIFQVKPKSLLWKKKKKFLVTSFHLNKSFFSPSFIIIIIIVTNIITILLWPVILVEWKRLFTSKLIISIIITYSNQKTKKFASLENRLVKKRGICTEFNIFNHTWIK